MTWSDICKTERYLLTSGAYEIRRTISDRLLTFRSTTIFCVLISSFVSACVPVYDSVGRLVLVCCGAKNELRISEHDRVYHVIADHNRLVGIIYDFCRVFTEVHECCLRVKFVVRRHFYLVLDAISLAVIFRLYKVICSRKYVKIVKNSLGITFVVTCNQK